MEFVYSDGGRSNYFKAKDVRDCVVRAIANATGLDYKEVYDKINAEAKREHTSKRRRVRSSARNGVFTSTAKRYIERDLGWIWVPCMGIGTGCQVHVKASELPSKGSYILNLSRHFSCWKDGQLYDTYDCSKHETRCVYGYWREPTEEERQMHEETKKQVQEYKDFVASEKEELARKKAEVKKYNDKITKKYAKRINKLKAQLRKLERERDSQLLEMPKQEKDSWAKRRFTL